MIDLLGRIPQSLHTFILLGLEGVLAADGRQLFQDGVEILLLIVELGENLSTPIRHSGHKVANDVQHRPVSLVVEHGGHLLDIEKRHVVLLVLAISSTDGFGMVSGPFEIFKAGYPHEIGEDAAGQGCAVFTHHVSIETDQAPPLDVLATRR